MAIYIGIEKYNSVNAAGTYKNSSSTIKITINGTDANYNSNSLTENDITVKVNGTALATQPTKKLTAGPSISNGVQYIVTLTGVTGDGDLTLEIAKDTLTDKAGNKNIVNTINNTGITMDNKVPETTAPTATSTTRAITVTNKQTDSASGIKTVEYAIYKNGAWSAYQSSNVFDSLAHSTTYYVRTRATDNVGNVSVSAQTTMATKQLTVGSLTMKKGSTSGSAYTNGTWSNEDVYVTVNQATYGTSTYYSTSGSAQTVSSTTATTIISTEGTSTLQVRTTDGYNTVYSGIYTIKVDKVVPTAMITPKITTSPGIAKNKAFNCGISLNDQNSGVIYTSSKYIFSTQAVAYGINSTSWSSATALSKAEQAVSLTPSTGSADGIPYYVHVLVTDNAGNKTEIISNALKSYLFWYENMPYGGSTAGYSASGLGVTIHVISGYSNLNFPAWTQDGGQDDIVWKGATGTDSYGSYFNLNTSEHGYQTGPYTIHIYANGTSTYVGAVYFTPAVYAKMYRSKVSTSGYVAYVSKMDTGSKINNMLFPTWTTTNGQDDIKWDAGGYTNPIWYYTVNKSAHNNESIGYYTHAYYQVNGSTTNRGMYTANIPLNLPTTTYAQKTNGYVASGMKLYLDGIDNEGTGTHSSSTSVWKDLSGNNMHGALNGYISASDNIWEDNCLNFFEESSVNFRTLNNNNITLEAVVSMDTLYNQENDEQVLFSNYESGGAGLAFGPSVYTDNKYSFKFTHYANSQSYYKSVTSNEDIEANKIYYISGTYDGTTAKFYLNGTLISSITTGGNLKTPEMNTIWALGGNPADGGINNSFFNGKVYSVRMYDRALTSSEITSNYNNDVSRFGVGKSVTLPKTSETEPYLPAGFTWDGKTTSSTGLLIKDKRGNEFTWVEVPKSITRSCSTDSEIETALRNYSVAYERVTGKPDTWYDGCGETEANYNYKKSKMLNSIRTYGGFWVGTYEAGTYTARTSSSSALTTVNSRKDLYPYSYVTMSQAESLSSGMISGNYTSSLMFGVQWNLICKYFEAKGAKTQAQIATDSSSWGNYKHCTFSISRGRYSTNSGTSWTSVSGTYTKPTSTTVFLTTGASERNNVLNIYDIAGNVWEKTLAYFQNAGENRITVDRGGAADDSSSEVGTPVTATWLGGSTISQPSFSIGFRPTIY